MIMSGLKCYYQYQLYVMLFCLTRKNDNKYIVKKKENSTESLKKIPNEVQK